MILLQVSAKALIYGSVQVATHYGVSEVVIGATIIAIGTSLPELAASVAGVLKNEDEMALGNIIGSNIFNLLAVLSLPGIIASPVVVDGTTLYLFILPMVLLTLAMGVMGYGFNNNKGHINRIEGGILVVFFVSWLTVTALHDMGKLTL